MASKGLTQAMELENFTFSATKAYCESLIDLTKLDGTNFSLPDALKEGKVPMKVSKDDALAIASLVRSWETCQERCRIHRGRPLPGSLKPEAKKKNKKDAFLNDILEEHTGNPSRSGAVPEAEKLKQSKAANDQSKHGDAIDIAKVIKDAAGPTDQDQSVPDAEAE